MDVQQVLARATEGLTAGRSFGPVIERDDCLIVPAAVVVGAGGGGGEGHPRGDATERTMAGGVGGVTLTWPLGAYVIRRESVRWVPALDATRVALAVIAVARVLVAGRRRRRSG